jgi:polar amino acid transport system substrate-binding protein
VFFALAVLGLGVAAQAQQPQPPAPVKVGYHPAAAPNEWVDPKTGLPQGANIEVMSAVAKDAGFRVEFHPLVTDDVLAALDAKIIDLEVVFQITPARRMLIDFSDPFYQVGEGLTVTKSDTKAYASWDELKGEVIGTTAGGPYVAPLQQSGLFKEVKQYGPEIFSALNSGEIKAVITNGLATIGTLQQGQFPDLQMVKTYQPRIVNPVGIGARKGQDDLLKRINASLAKLKADGTIKTIFAKYEIDFALVK